MTRDAGQLTTRQAAVGALGIAAVVVGIVAALALLLGRGEQVQPIEAPADPGTAAGERCPEPPKHLVTIASEDLIECPQTFDGALVRYRGESVRAVLRRGERAWVHLNDDPYALDIGPLPAHRTAVGGNAGIPVWLPAETADRITYVGDARHRGDVLEVVGIFRRTHPADDGGPAIHAETAVIHEVGHPVQRSVTPPRAAVALAALALATAATLVAHLRPR